MDVVSESGSSPASVLPCPVVGPVVFLMLVTGVGLAQRESLVGVGVVYLSAPVPLKPLVIVLVGEEEETEFRA